MRRVLFGLSLLAIVATAEGVSAQTKPQPFPKPGPPPAERPVTPQDAPVVRSAPTAPPQDASEPAEGSLGVPIHESAQFITSYDAGRGQRYYLYGTTATFAEIVQYYKTALKQRGDLVLPEPPIHQFDIGRFREETMAFPPSVTVKDYTWGGSAGYLNPRRGAQPARFTTIIQIVPNPPAVPR